ncbi:MAG: ABC transporter permease, partial [Acidobacteria bacterium]|nr:ABC transporter permease [Acidobacteriota bacterium]
MAPLAALRQALRALSRSPGLSVAALLSLVLGIGATSALYTVVQALLLRPLPYTDANRLVILWNRSPGLNIAEDWFSTAQYFDIKTRHQGLAEVAIALGANANLTGDGPPERIGTLRVSSHLLSMLGAEALHGRLLTADDDRPGTTPVAILSHGLWLRRYGGAPDVVGRPLLINGATYTIAGILRDGFSLPREVLPTLGVVDDGDVFLPLPLGADAATVRTREDYNLIGRLRDGVSLHEAQTEMDDLTARLRTEHPDVYPPNGGLTFSLVPLHEQVVGDVRLPLLLLSGAVGCVLRIVCANVANLLLARALDRRREMAVRVALGATRGQILRQTLVESLLLSSAGGLGGLVLAGLALRWLQVVRPPSVPRLDAITLDPWAITFTCGVSLIVGLAVGLLPARRAGRDIQETLRDGARGVTHAGSLWSRGHGTRRLLLIGQLALSVWLLISAGLLIRSFARLHTVSPGFSPQGVLTMELTLTGPKYPGAPDIRQAYRALFDRLEALPGVETAGGVTSLPFSNFFAWGPITIEGRTPPPGERFINADQRTVGGRYFESLQ